jgi:hypothetical protein
VERPLDYEVICCYSTHLEHVLGRIRDILEYDPVFFLSGQGGAVLTQGTVVVRYRHSVAGLLRALARIVSFADMCCFETSGRVSVATHSALSYAVRKLPEKIEMITLCEETCNE